MISDPLLPMPRKRNLVLVATLAFLVAAALGAAGFWILITPDNPLTSLFRRPISDTDARVIIGPYPVEGDFRLLERNGVATIVSLLNPDLPYEGILIERERKLARRHGMRLLNFPMSSILGQRFGETYDRNAADAADAIARESGKVYLHCYLGLHRIEAVQRALAERATATGEYVIREGERSDPVRALDRADAAFAAGRYREALDALAEIAEPDRAARMLRAWATYRLGDSAAAREMFAKMVAKTPNDIDARAGLGFSALRDGDLEAAERQFALILERQPVRAEALVGMGLVRYRQDRLDEAAAHLQEALRQDPNNDDARQTLDAIGPRPALPKRGRSPKPQRSTAASPSGRKP